MMKTVILSASTQSGLDEYRRILANPINTIERRRIIIPEEYLEDDEDTDEEEFGDMDGVCIELKYSENPGFPDILNYQKDVEHFWLPVNPTSSRSAAVRASVFEEFISDPNVEVLHENRVLFNNSSFLVVIEFINSSKISNGAIFRNPKHSVKKSNRYFDPTTQTYIIR